MTIAKAIQRYLLPALLLCVAVLMTGCAHEPVEGRVTCVSPPAQLPEPVDFGRGPIFSVGFQLARENPQPAYLTSFSVRLHDDRGKAVLPGGPSLDWWEVSWAQPEQHGKLIGRAAGDSTTIVRLRGTDPDFHFPDGYALPLLCNEPLTFRAGWSSGQASKGCTAQLEATFLRARQIEGEPPQAVMMQSAWAGETPVFKGPNSWIVPDGKTIRGSYVLAPGATVLRDQWLKGPGIGNLKTSISVSLTEGKFVSFEPDDPESVPRPTILGVNLVLLDKQWSGWK